MEHCDECGFGYGELRDEDVPSALAVLGARYARVLAGADRVRLTTRPQPAVWSALEYACHVRDVLLVQRDRVILALVEDNPGFARMYRDERAEITRYNEEQPAEVGAHVEVAGALLARLFDGLSPEQLARPCIYNFPEPSERDVAWLAHHALHEGEHHLRDIEAALAAGG